MADFDLRREPTHFGAGRHHFIIKLRAEITIFISSLDVTHH
jgi:hypothetical protein